METGGRNAAMGKRTFTVLTCIAILVGIAVVAVTATRKAGSNIIKMATTTSLQDSGLLGTLLPNFEKESGYKVHVIAVGSGKALKHGENGDVDVVFTHDPAAEEKFMKSGFGVNRREVMYNYFVVVGPEEDPASIRADEDAAEAFKKIAAGNYTFVSRGDESGTHVKEKSIWSAAGIAPSGKWYVSTGQGMGAVLTIADEMRGYALTDKATYLAMRDKISLVILCQQSEKLLNRYSVMAVNPQRHSHVNSAGANALIEWLVSPEARKAITNFTKSGEQLFFVERPE
jgi:tungstate transport system substrate-binding protein